MAARFITKRPTARKVVRPRPNSTIPHKIEKIDEEYVDETPEAEVIAVVDPVITEAAPKTTARKAKVRKTNTTPQDEPIVEEVKLTDDTPTE